MHIVITESNQLIDWILKLQCAYVCDELDLYLRVELFAISAKRFFKPSYYHYRTDARILCYRVNSQFQRKLAPVELIISNHSFGITVMSVLKIKNSNF